jgi:tetratricopeptide (TPR) repeat protein
MIRILTIIYVLLNTFNVYCGDIEQKELQTINNSVDLLYKEKFEDALAGFTFLKDSYPDYPIGDFFLGFYYNFLGSYYETDYFDSKIVLYFDLAEKKADFHLRHNKKDPWMNFYKGASLVNRGYLLGRDGKRLSGLGKTYSGISYIEDCLDYDKDHGDALLLLGVYRFYKSTLLSWIYDNRDEAIKIVEKSIEKSDFSKMTAVSTLGWINIDYEKPERAEKLADETLKLYPDLHIFGFLKARALFEQKKYAEAIEYYLKLEKKIISLENKYSGTDLFNIYYFLCLSHKNSGTKAESEKYLELALYSNLKPREREILSDRIEELEDIRRSKNR